MSRHKGLPRYENPASVEVGDTIRVAWKTGDIEHTRTAKVYRKVDDGPYDIFFTEDGHEIFRWMVSGKFQPRITLLAVEQTASVIALDGIEELERLLA